MQEVIYGDGFSCTFVHSAFIDRKSLRNYLSALVTIVLKVPRKLSVIWSRVISGYARCAEIAYAGYWQSVDRFYGECAQRKAVTSLQTVESVKHSVVLMDICSEIAIKLKK